MNIFLSILTFLIEVWVGHLLYTKTEFKWLEVLFTQLLIGAIMVFIDIILTKAGLI